MHFFSISYPRGLPTNVFWTAVFADTFFQKFITGVYKHSFWWKKNCSIAIFSITRLEWGKKTLPSLFGKHFRFKQRTQGFKSIAFQEIRLHSLDAENFLSITKRCFSEIEAAGFENTFFHSKREESYINSFESNNYYEILKTLYKILIK